jgi:rare lipoprotein A
MIDLLRLKALIICFVLTIVCINTEANRANDKRNIKTGTASYYHDNLNGRRTSSGEKFNNKLYTAAHPSLPFGTFVLVTNLENGKSVVVKINDRFRQRKNHILDVTKAAAREIDMIRYGIARISMQVVDTVKVVDFMITDTIPYDFVTYKLEAGKINIIAKPEISLRNYRNPGK